MLKELRKIIDTSADNCNKELETIKMNRSKLDNSTAEIKTNLEAMTSRINDTEESVSDLEDGIREITQSEQKTEKQMYRKAKATYKICGIT